MNRFPGFGQRIRLRLRATGFWKKGRPDVSRFCIERGYRPQYVYAWLKDRIPGDENLRRLANDLGVTVAWLMLGHESGTAVAEEAIPVAAGAAAVPEVRLPSTSPSPGPRGGVRPSSPPLQAESHDAQIIDFKRLREVTAELGRLQADLEAIFLAFPDLYLWLDDRGVVLGYRAGSGLELEVPGAETPGRRIDDLVPPEAAAAIEAGLHRAIGAGAPVLVEYARPSVGRSFEARLLPLRVEGPHEGSVLAIIRDITERKRGEESLRMSEARYRAIVEDQTDLIARSRPGGVMTFVNASYAQVLGKTPEELVGTSYHTRLAPSESAKVHAAVATLSAARPVATVEIEMMIGGEARWYHWTKRAIFDGSGNLVEIQGVGRDITERKRAEAALNERAAIFQRIFEETRLAMVLLDRTGRPVASNRAFREMLGYTEEDLRGKTFADYTHPDDVEEGLAIWRELVEGKRDHDTRTKRYVTRDGRILGVQLTVSLIRDASGGPAFAVSVIEQLPG